MVNEEKDLPLVSNIMDLHVRHYILNLTCDFQKKIFRGTTVLYLEPVADDRSSGAVASKCSPCCQHSSYSESVTVPLPGIQSYEDKLLVTPEIDHGTRNLLCGTLYNNAESVFNENSKDKCISASEKVEVKYDEPKEFTCILDCRQLKIESVEEVETDTEKFLIERFSRNVPDFSSKCVLKYFVDEWSLQIWKEGVYCRFCFPKFVRIVYETVPEGNSLLWASDQDGNPAVFTYGAWINNRALFPCQEPPGATATWSATISTSELAIVLMSGDTEPVKYIRNGLLHYFYHSKAALPMCTLSLAVGFWKGEKITGGYCDSSSVVRCRLFAPSSLLENAKKEFADYILEAVKAAVYFFGEYPFPRIDLLIVPQVFGSLGMANPNLIFLSQSLLAGDKSMCVKVAHEVAHAWFGLMIGCSDWTEEWLSEGFATFLEDIIHAKAVHMTSSEKTDFMELKSHLRLMALEAEMENVAPDLLKLRPNEGKDFTKTIDGKNAVIVKNGQNPEKAFIQVHYLKGFFLLKYLSNVVGLWHFLDFLKLYVNKYKGKLVGSLEVFQMFVETFPQFCVIENISLDYLTSHWLNSSDIPKEILHCQPLPSNSLFRTVLSDAEKWKTQNRTLLRRRSPCKKRRRLNNYEALNPVQLILLLEELLKEERVSPVLLKKLEYTYNLNNANADVRHRWCELVIKHRYIPGYVCVNKFLQKDLAMGVYLHCELIFSEIPSQRNIIKESMKDMLDKMEPNQAATICKWLEDAAD